jgi:hypothetical protein
MALSKDDREFVRGVYRLVADRALEPDDPLYEPIHEQMNEDDPVAIMQSRIELADVQTMQLYSGFSGSGKTTELFRLRRNLREQGYVVLYADADSYVNYVEPLTIADMLMVAAGAFSDADLAPCRIAEECLRWANRSSGTVTPCARICRHIVAGRFDRIGSNREQSGSLLGGLQGARRNAGLVLAAGDGS